MQTTTKLFVALGVAVLWVPAASMAGPQAPIKVVAVRHVGNANVIKVSYRDLDLRRASQARVLVARVDRAAHQVCAPHLYTPRLDTLIERTCIDGALSDAAPQMSLARKRAQEIARTGSSPIPQIALVDGAGF